MQALNKINLDGEKPQEKMNMNFKLLENIIADLELRIDELEERIEDLEQE